MFSIFVLLADWGLFMRGGGRWDRWRHHSIAHRLEGQEDPTPPTSSCDGTLLFGSREAAPSSDEVLRIEHMKPPPRGNSPIYFWCILF